jgi:glycosyltransferase involved in cell wall biosynthesis
VKIAVVCPRYYPHVGGVQASVKEVSERLVKWGLDVEVLTTDPTHELLSEENINGVRVKRFRSCAPGEAYYVSRDLKSYLMHSRYDVVDAHNYHAFPALYAAEAKTTNRLVFTPTYHGTGHTFFRSLLHRAYRPIGRKIFRASDIVICRSRDEIRHVTSDFDVAKKIVLIPNGISSAEFVGLKKTVDPSCTKILCVARLERYKGIQYVIQAVSRIRGKATLDIVGVGPYGNNLVRLASKLGISDRITFRSNLNRRDLLSLYACANVLVLLSKYEAFGIVVAEALAAGTRCIVAQVPGLGHWIDERNVFGIPYPIDLNRLAEMMVEVGEKQADDVRLYDWEDIASETRKIYTG